MEKETMTIEDAHRRIKELEEELEETRKELSETKTLYDFSRRQRNKYEETLDAILSVVNLSKL